MKIANKIQLWAVTLVAALFVSCDFTPKLYKEIIQAQKFLMEQNYDRAIIKYEQILDENPSNEIKVKIYFQLGELYAIQLSNYDKGLDYFKKIKKIYQSPLWLVKAEEKIADIQFSYNKKFYESAKSYEMLVNFTPRLKNFDFYQYRLGLSYLSSNQLEKSAEVFTKISKNSTHKYFVKSIYQLGMISFRQEKWSRAIAYWNEYIQREKRKDEIIKTKFLMANAYETMEKLKEAYNLYYSLLGEYPNTGVIQSRLNSIYDRKVSRKR